MMKKAAGILTITGYPYFVRVAGIEWRRMKKEDRDEYARIAKQECEIYK